MNLDFINYINSYRINFNKNTQESKQVGVIADKINI